MAEQSCFTCWLDCRLGKFSVVVEPVIKLQKKGKERRGSVEELTSGGLMPMPGYGLMGQRWVKSQPPREPQSATTESGRRGARAIARC